MGYNTMPYVGKGFIDEGKGTGRSFRYFYWGGFRCTVADPGVFLLFRGMKTVATKCVNLRFF
jgi:hypothetical protein